MFRSSAVRKIAKLTTFALGLTTFSYLANLSISPTELNQSSLQLRSAQASSSACGPDNSRAGRAATKFFLYPYMNTFDPACQNHDKCYGTLKQTGKTKAQCEREFRRDLYKVCNDRSLWKKVSQDVFGFVTNPKLWGSIKSPCKRQADYAYWAVSQFGESALNASKQSIHSLKIIKVRANRIDDRWSDDELKVCVTVKNDGNLRTEWDLVLLDKKGKIVDTEPDTYERNIKVGRTDQECVATRGTRFSISDLGSTARVVVRIDDTPGVAPFTPIAKISVPTRRRKDKFTSVRFNQPSRMESFQRLKRQKSR